MRDNLTAPFCLWLVVSSSSNFSSILSMLFVLFRFHLSLNRCRLLQREHTRARHHLIQRNRTPRRRATLAGVSPPLSPVTTSLLQFPLVVTLFSISRRVGFASANGGSCEQQGRFTEISKTVGPTTTSGNRHAISFTYYVRGNIVRWLKKEGDNVSPVEVLCEVETDKATVEMACMEEGYLAKILRGDGSQRIKVGEPPAY